MSLFYATLAFGDAISTTAQAYLPSLRTETDRRRLVRRLLLLGALTGASTALLILLPMLPLGLPALLRVFTTDAAVSRVLVRLLPFAATCSLAFNVASAAEARSPQA